jgi:hypothetical protein
MKVGCGFDFNFTKETERLWCRNEKGAIDTGSTHSNTNRESTWRTGGFAMYIGSKTFRLMALHDGME